MVFSGLPLSLAKLQKLERLELGSSSKDKLRRLQLLQERISFGNGIIEREEHTVIIPQEIITKGGNEVMAYLRA